MKLAVKTLKGEKFDVIVEESHTILEVKSIIETNKNELIASTLKLIHSGKILKDTDTIASCQMKENDFLVVMVTKSKKQPPTAAAANSATTTTVVPPKVDTTTTASTENEATTGTTSTPSNAANTTDDTATTTPAVTSTTTPAAPTRPTSTTVVSDDVVMNLVSMGFPEAEVRHCLHVAHGNPDIAVEFLTNGIPENVSEAANLIQTASNQSTPAVGSSSSSSQQQPLQSLRNHPQFDALRQLVQSNPGALQQVLTQIGQQQPTLLAEINNNQSLFLEMMNEPINTTSSSSSSTTGSNSNNRSVSTSSGGGTTSSSTSNNDDSQSMMMDGFGAGNPAQMAQMIQNMTAEELQQMAMMMGISADQLRDTAQMIGQMPPEQLNQFMMQAMSGDGMMMGGGGNSTGGQQVLRLTEEEMAAVDRLTEMGFDRSEAAQAFLACDKNEALAANLLMDSMANGGFFGGGGGNDNNNDQDDDDDDNMYD